jgi:hypothetical protein
VPALRLTPNQSTSPADSIDPVTVAVVAAKVPVPAASVER